MESVNVKNLSEVEVLETHFKEKMKSLNLLIEDATNEYVLRRMELERRKLETTDNEQPRLLNAKQASEILGISKNYLYQLVYRGELKPVRIGLKGAIIRFHKKDLYDYMNGVRPEKKSEIDKLAEEYITSHQSPITGK